MEYTDGNCKYKVEKIGGGGVLRGVILAFSGQFDSNGYPIDKNTGNADTTWHLCDGTNGTPDLRGRFILGASSSHAVGTTGGEEAHSLTPTENAPHNHTATCSNAGGHNHTIPIITSSTKYDDNGAAYESGHHGNDSSTTDSGWHVHTITIGVSGSGAPHNNMPPYYTLSYIMKL
ncbi:phage tail protein [Allisonella histaminiformans]|uniref:phage tail protein n=1 Tax=Allisonella histaminiformans TaxID=209880 RepID=UPI00389051DA